jgi:hypothetical protein
MMAVLDLPALHSRVEAIAGPVLIYVVPVDYVMQGMIADTGPQWRLYEHHQTLAMIADWVLHPFRHLQEAHAMMPHDMSGVLAGPTIPGGTVRRLIVLRVSGPSPATLPGALFAINASRDPQFYADVDMRNVALVDMRALGPGTGWGRVPTPMF